MADETKMVTPGGALDKLAKLLAAENIMVEHKPIKTAYFDVKNRVLALPMWKEMTETLYHMLVLHEVGHALETPADGWKGAIDKVKEEEQSQRIASTFQGYLNVVEDARIERKMKTKFPGARKDFIEGYDWLHQQDFFAVKNEDLEKLPLIDRINLYFKLGTRLRFKFNEEEHAFVRRAEQTITFDDVVKLAEDLLAYSKLKKEQDQEDEDEFKLKVKSEFGDEEDDSESDWDEGDDDYDSSNSKDDRSDRSMDKSKEDGDKPQSTSAEKQGGSSNKPMMGPEESKTDRAMNDRMEELLDQSLTGREFRYITFPKDLTYEEFTVGYKKVLDKIGAQFAAASDRARLDGYRNWLLTKFRSENNSAINYMVKEFEMKKAAVAYSRSRQSKTGVIDVNKLHSYKFNDDIFKRLTIEPTGKNHGVVAILDMSGSMSNSYLGAMDQLICLTMFCRRVGIPHRIYGFTQCAGEFNTKVDKRTDAKRALVNRIANRLRGKDFVFPDMGFDLLEFFHEDMTLKEFNTMVGTLLMSAKRYEGRGDEYTKEMPASSFIDSAFGYGYGGGLQFLGLGGTPLNDALLVSRDLMAKFRKEKNIQLMNFVCITDGDSNSSNYYRHRGTGYGNGYSNVVGYDTTSLPYGYHSRVTTIFVDEESRIQTSMTFDSQHRVTAMLARTVRHSQDATFVGFYIVNGAYDVRHVSYRFMNANDANKFQESWKKNKGGAVVPGMLSFDEFYLVQGGKNLQAQQAKFEEANDLKKGQLARAFITAQGKRGTSRAILGKFIEKIAA
jgi:hypothetical protein